MRLSRQKLDELNGGAPRCKHCERRKRRPVGGSRGLCATCYYTRAIRNQYPPDGQYGQRVEDVLAAEALLPDRPTDAPPLSEEKVAVMRERARKRQQLFHPADGRMTWARVVFDDEEEPEAEEWVGPALKGEAGRC